MVYRLRIAVCALALVACSSEGDAPETTIDASAADGAGQGGGGGGSGFVTSQHDAGTHDAGTRDAGTHDAGTHDAGTHDAGAVNGGGFDPGPGWTLVVAATSSTAPRYARPMRRAGCSRPAATAGATTSSSTTPTAPTTPRSTATACLVITAKTESYMGRDYTSARLKTQGKFEHTYGRFEARIKIPKGQGIWPAFWMLGNNIGNAGWPDVRRDRHHGEHRQGADDRPRHDRTARVTRAAAARACRTCSPATRRSRTTFTSYAIEWEPDEVRLVRRRHAVRDARRRPTCPTATNWVYDHPFFILLNLAVGGQWPGNPDGSTQFPQTMMVDYVRVYDATP